MPENGMYFQGDVKNVLTGLALTVDALPVDATWKDGYRAALIAVAASFGLKPFERTPGTTDQFYMDRKRAP